MQHRPSKSEKEDRLLSLLKYRDELEFDNSPDRIRHAHPKSKKTIAEWKAYLQLPAGVQEKRLVVWEQYYKTVREQSPMVALVREQRNAAKIGNWGRVRDLAQQARRMRENGDQNIIPIPPYSDPWEFNYGWVKAYKDTNVKIQELQGELQKPLIEEEEKIWNE